MSLASRSRVRTSPAVTDPLSSWAMGGFEAMATVTVAAFETFPSASATVYCRLKVPVGSVSAGV